MTEAHIPFTRRIPFTRQALRRVALAHAFQLVTGGFPLTRDEAEKILAAVDAVDAALPTFGERHAPPDAPLETSEAEARTPTFMSSVEHMELDSPLPEQQP